MRMDRRTLLKLLPDQLLSSYAAGTSVIPFHAKRARARDLGIRFGTMATGPVECDHRCARG